MHACLVGLMISLAAAQSPRTRAEDPRVARAVREVEAVVARGPFTPAGLHVELPATRPAPHAFTLRIARR